MDVHPPQSVVSGSTTEMGSASFLKKRSAQQECGLILTNSFPSMWVYKVWMIEWMILRMIEWMWMILRMIEWMILWMIERNDGCMDDQTKEEFISIITDSELAMPRQKRWMPNRQQKRSYSLGALMGYRCVKVSPTQIMAAPSQKIWPLRVRLTPRVVVEVGAVVDGQRGLAEPQRTVLASANMQEEKLLATTNLPIPTTGRQLSAYEMQQLMSHAGRAGGLETTFSQWRMMQLTKMLRKMKQASRQQNSTQVYPTIRIIPTPQPSSRKWMLLKKPFTQLSTFVPSPRVIAQKSKSITGQEQITRNLVEQSPRLLQYSLQSEGSRKAYEKQRKAMISKGIRKFPKARPFSLAFTSTTTAPSTTQNPQKRQSLQKLSPKIVSSMSTVSSTRIKVTMVPMRSPLPSYRLTTWYANTISDNFHSSHEQIRLMATPTAELGPLAKLLNMPVESVQVAVSVQEEMEKELLQQQEACVPTAKKSMAHTPMFMPMARMQRQSWMKQFDLDGASSLSSTYLPSSWQALASEQAGFVGSPGGQRCIQMEAGLLPWVYIFNYIMDGSSLVHPIKYPASHRGAFIPTAQAQIPSSFSIKYRKWYGSVL